MKNKQKPNSINKTIKRNLTIKILIISALIVYVYLTIKLIFPCMDFYLVDFPCFYELNDGVLEADFLEPDDMKDLTIFVSVYPEHASGGYCVDETASKGEFVNFFGHKIQLTDTELLIDDKIIKTGERIYTSKKRIKPTNIWWIYRDEFTLKNHGQIYGLIKNNPYRNPPKIMVYPSDSITEIDRERNTTISVTKLASPSVLVTGYDSTSMYLNFITVFIHNGLLICLFVLTVKMIRNKSSSR